VHWVSGNSEREEAETLDGAWRERVASWPIALSLDGVLFCHGSPRRDDEMLTRATPDAAMAEAVAGVSERLVVGGHTHQQFIRTVGERVVANAGSVGMPYEGRAGAFWMVVENGEPRLRETAYDVAAWIAELRAAGFADVDKQFEDSLVDPVDADYVTMFFEHLAGRGEHPGEPDAA
jgi:predicted phosphodiesterase